MRDYKLERAVATHNDDVEAETLWLLDMPVKRLFRRVNSQRHTTCATHSEISKFKYGILYTGYRVFVKLAKVILLKH